MKNDSNEEEYTLEEKRKILVNNIRQLNTRSFRFDELNKVAKKVGLSSSTGSEAIIKKIEKLEGENDEKIINKLFEEVSSLLQVHTALDSKRIYLYEVPNDELLVETFAQTSDHLSTPISNSTKNRNWC